MNKLVIPIALIGVGVAGLLAMGVAGGVPEVQAREVAAGGYRDGVVKVHGLLHEIQNGERPLRFVLRDKDRADALLPIFADKMRPDTFQVGYDVSVEGRWDESRGAFVAHQIYTKCPSKYEDEAKQGIGSAEEKRRREKAAPETR